MIRYSNVRYPHRPSSTVLDQTTGTPVQQDSMSSGELAFATIARAIVDHGRSLDWECIAELKVLLDAS